MQKMSNNSEQNLYHLTQNHFQVMQLKFIWYFKYDNVLFLIWNILFGSLIFEQFQFW